MLTKVTIYSQWTNLDPLVLNVINRPETDLFQARNIEGLGAVAAEVNTTKLGSIDGESFVGSNVGKRNIVFTIGLTPDWINWTPSKLRRLLDKYFMPKLRVRMVFETMEFSPVEIFGYIESNEPNMFTNDPEQVISVICPDLYFKSVSPTVVVGSSDMDPMDIDYEGNVETGMTVLVVGRDGVPTWVKIRVNDSLENSIQVANPIGLVPVRNYIMSSIPGDKYVRKITTTGALVTNLLNGAIIVDNNDRDRQWPKIGPGTQDFAVTSDVGIQDWTLTYRNQFASL